MQPDVVAEQPEDGFTAQQRDQSDNAGRQCRWVADDHAPGNRAEHDANNDIEPREPREHSCTKDPHEEKEHQVDDDRRDDHDGYSPQFDPNVSTSCSCVRLKASMPSY